MVVHCGTRMKIPNREFWKMSGSGNDFVFFDARRDAPGVLERADVVAAVCSRRTGVGADGVVFIEPDAAQPFGIRYLNRDGSLAELCGNASLCTVTLAIELEIASGSRDFLFQSTSGVIRGRHVAGLPEVDIAPITETTPSIGIPLTTGERRIGFARVGVPHLVVEVDDVEHVDVEGRGSQLRYWPTLPDGANANFVSRSAHGWHVRTFERGVEQETLACGTGAVATAALLGAWRLSDRTADLVTRSGNHLIATVPAVEGQSPTLRGEGRIVFTGSLRDVLP